jgi:hypothetical protein
MALVFQSPDLELLPTIFNRLYSDSGVRLATSYDPRLMDHFLLIYKEEFDGHLELRIPHDVIALGGVLGWIDEQVSGFLSSLKRREKIDEQIHSQGEAEATSCG